MLPELRKWLRSKDRMDMYRKAAVAIGLFGLLFAIIAMPLLTLGHIACGVGALVIAVILISITTLIAYKDM